MGRAMIVFCEKVIQFPLTGDNMEMLGAVYDDPYAPALSGFDRDEAGRQVGSFGWSVGITFGQRLLAQGVRWEPANRIAVCLAPRLQTGRVGSYRRGPPAGSWEGREDFGVTVGLSPGTWGGDPAPGQARAPGRARDPRSPPTLRQGGFGLARGSVLSRRPELPAGPGGLA
jgi:hypothetical protein